MIPNPLFHVAAPVFALLADVGVLGPLFGITPDFRLPPIWAYPAAIILLILVGVTSLGLAKLYVKIKVALGLE